MNCLDLYSCLPIDYDDPNDQYNAYNSNNAQFRPLHLCYISNNASFCHLAQTTPYLL